MGFIFAKMHASHTGFVARTIGLFTLIWLHGVTGGANGQVVCQTTQDGIVAHASFELSSSDWEALVRLGEGVTMDASLDEAWEGVQILDDSEVWTACTLDEAKRLSNLPVAKRRRRLTVQHALGKTYLVGEFPVVRWDVDRGWEKCLSAQYVLGESPAGSTRNGRAWPEASVLAEGTWWRFSTTEEGVHCLDYDDLSAAGLNPAQLDPDALRIFGHGGQALPFNNDVERALDVPQVAVVRRGLEDGSFDPGDGLCWFAPSLTQWDWDEDEGWNHTPQPWADTARWFLRVDAPATMEMALIPSDTAYAGEVIGERVSHEHRGVIDKPLVNLIKSGRNWMGDRLTALGTSTFAWNVPIPGALVGEEATVKFAAAMRTTGSGSNSQLRYAFEGEEVTFTDGVLSSNATAYALPRKGQMTRPLTAEGVQVLTTLVPGTSESDAWMDYLSYSVPQGLQYNGGQALFNGLPSNDGGVQYTVVGSVPPNEVWDVTDFADVRKVPFELTGNGFGWRAAADTVNRYCAFRWSSVLHPTNLRPQANSNIHALGDVDQVIVTVPSMLEPADSLAALHGLLGKRVAVVMQQDIFDAFSTGMGDPTSIKMLMMMLRDRAMQSGVEPPRQLLLFGDASYENRNLQGNGDFIVGYYSNESLSTTTSYISDDYFTLTAEGQGEAPADKLQFGVGRVPASTLDDAWAFVNKFRTYMGFNEGEGSAASCVDPNGGSSYGPWRNRILFVSDDQDGNGVDGHKYMKYSENHSGQIRANHTSYDVTKIYADAYIQTNTPGGERYEGAAAEIARRVDEGALIVNYVGHGGERGWAHERILNLQTIQGWSNVTRLPLFMTATCELFRHDDSDVYSAGEAILFNPDGGGAALFTTTRTVYSNGNEQINAAFFSTALDKSDPTRCIGDIYASTKNDENVTADVNSRNFSLMGDPGMRLAYPEHRVFVTEVPDTLRSLDLVTIRGFVGTVQGDTLHDFSGVVVPTVFDKQATVTTLDNDDAFGPYSYEVFQNVLHKGLATVDQGAFEFSFIVPKDINYAYGPGRVSLYAVDGTSDAHGFSESFVIGGNNEDGLDDDQEPEVTLYINDTLFEAGDIVHEDPWLYAKVFDESGINTSGNGIGHDLKAVLDDDEANPFVLNQYFISDLDTYQSGTIRFPLQDLEDGTHELSLKVWDVANNSASAFTHFVVASSLEVALVEVLAYPNPATDHVTFRASTNQACRPSNVTLEVFDMRGNKVHETKYVGEPLGFVDDGMTWDLKPSTGGSVLPGVYVFRVRWENEFGQAAQYADQLVVVRP